MVKELVAARELIWQLIYRDIATRYRQSFLGYIWALVPPIVTIAIFAFLARHRVINMGPTEMPYVVHGLWSLTFWYLFAGTLQGGTNSLVEAGTLVTKIQFNKEALVVAALGQPLIDFLIRLVPVSLVMIWYGFTPSPHALWIPLVMVVTVMMALGFGFILSIVNLVFRDIGNVVGVVLNFAIFLAPILYPPPSASPFYLVNILNPFSPLLIATQDLLMGKPISYPLPLAFAVAFSLLIFFGGWHFFRITMPKIAERA